MTSIGGGNPTVSSEMLWRRASYDLSKLPLDGAKMTYRARLEFDSGAEDADVYCQVLEVLRSWLEGEELKHGESDDAEVLLLLRSTELFSKDSTSACADDTYLCVATLCAGKEGLSERYCSIRYVERDVLHGYRFWITDVGLTSLSPGSCVMNMRKRYLDDSTFIYESEEPQRRAPNLLRQLLRIPGCRVRNGGTTLQDSPLEITAQTLGEFVLELTSRSRTVPLVVIAAQESDGRTGSYLVRPRYLARRLRGVANVYTLNRNIDTVERAYTRIFGNPETPAFKYRLEPGALRIFWSGVDLEHPGEYDYARHRFFTAESLLTADEEQVIQNITDGITRMEMRRAGEVLDLRSLEQQRSKAETRRLESARTELSERVADSEERRKKLEQDLRSVGEWRAQDEELIDGIRELEQLRDVLTKQNEELKKDLAMYEGGCTAEDYNELYGMVEEYERKANDAEGVARNLESRLGYSEHLNKGLREELQAERERSRSNASMADLLMSVGEYLRDGKSAVMLAQRALSGRVVLLKEAIDSAERFTGDASEMYAALVSLYTVLWEMRFGVSGSASVSEDDFKARSGFEISFHESKQTNRDSSLASLRKCVFEGKQLNMTPHIKGGNRHKGYLRVHFAFVPEQRLIVVGHCGDHMRTAGTMRIK